MVFIFACWRRVVVSSCRRVGVRDPSEEAGYPKRVARICRATAASKGGADVLVQRGDTCEDVAEASAVYPGRAKDHAPPPGRVIQNHHL